MSEHDGARVLVVDDHADSADTLAWLLRLWGHEAEARYDGGSALESARASPPDVLVLDVAMPGMDGLEVARSLRGQACSAGPVIVAVSGYGDEAFLLRAREEGF